MPATFTVDNAAPYFSPWVWRKSGSSYALSNHLGAYVKFNFTGPSVAVTFDMAHLSGVSATDLPLLSYAVDGVRSTYQLQASDTTKTFASGLAAGPHSFQLDFIAYNGTYDAWNTPVLAVKITAFVLGGGESISAPAIAPFTMAVFGASSTQGAEVYGSNGLVTDHDARASCVRLIAERLGCEYGMICAGGIGYQQASASINYPALKDSYTAYSSGQSRLVGGLLSPIPDYLFTDLGINDSATGLAAVITTQIGNWRTICGGGTTTKFLIAVPWNGVNASAVTTGFTNAADANAILINTGRTNYDHVTSGHLSAAGSIDFAADIVIATGFPRLDTGPTVTRLSATKVDISWPAATSGSGTKTYTPEYVQVDANGYPLASDDWHQAPALTGLSAVIAGLTTNQPYAFRVRASGNAA